jgi:peptide/nickel transport system permease protein
MNVVWPWGKKRKLQSTERGEDYYLAGQWTLMWRKFRRHRIARLSLLVLGIFYFIAIFADFFSVQGLRGYDSRFTNAPPTRIHIWHPEDGLTTPFVYGLVFERDPETMRRRYVADESVRYQINFFTRGETYRFWGLFEMDFRLFGVDEPGRIFLLGTDSMGRDLFSRIVHGARISLSIGMVGVFISLVVGTIMGSISGYFGGVIDTVIQRLIEVLRSFPEIPLWMGLSAALPPNMPLVRTYFLITIILSFIGWTGLARVVRGKFISMREEDYIMAAKVSGASDARIIRRHMIPGFMSYLLVEITLAVPRMILAETSLSFLGLGLRSPVTSWGVLLQEAQSIQAISLYPWLLVPVIPVIITVLAFNFAGDGLRDAADPYHEG